MLCPRRAKPSDEDVDSRSDMKDGPKMGLASRRVEIQI